MERDASPCVPGCQNREYFTLSRSLRRAARPSAEAPGRVRSTKSFHHTPAPQDLLQLRRKIYVVAYQCRRTPKQRHPENHHHIFERQHNCVSRTTGSTQPLQKTHLPHSNTAPAKTSHRCPAKARANSAVPRTSSPRPPVGRAMRCVLTAASRIINRKTARSRIQSSTTASAAAAKVASASNVNPVMPILGFLPFAANPGGPVSGSIGQLSRNNKAIAAPSCAR